MNKPTEGVCLLSSVPIYFIHRFAVGCFYLIRQSVPVFHLGFPLVSSSFLYSVSSSLPSRVCNSLVPYCLLSSVSSASRLVPVISSIVELRGIGLCVLISPVLPPFHPDPRLSPVHSEFNPSRLPSREEIITSSGNLAS